MTKKILIILILAVLVFLIFMSRKEKNVSYAPTEKKIETKIEDKKSTEAVKTDSVENKQANQTNQETNNMGLEIKTTQEGTGDREVKKGDVVSVLYTGKFTDGKVFDSTSKNGDRPFTFTVGQGVIEGWSQGVLGMKVGEKRNLIIPSDLAYGDAGYPGAIPPRATLVFDIEVLEIK